MDHDYILNSGDVKANICIKPQVCSSTCVFSTCTSTCMDLRRTSMLGPRWQNKMSRVGCSGSICNKVEFTKPSWCHRERRCLRNNSKPLQWPPLLPNLRAPPHPRRRHHPRLCPPPATAPFFVALKLLQVQMAKRWEMVDGHIDDITNSRAGGMATWSMATPDWARVRPRCQRCQGALRRRGRGWPGWGRPRPTRGHRSARQVCRFFQVWTRAGWTQMDWKGCNSIWRNWGVLKMGRGQLPNPGHVGP